MLALLPAAPAWARSKQSWLIASGDVGGGSFALAQELVQRLSAPAGRHLKPVLAMAQPSASSASALVKFSRGLAQAVVIPGLLAGPQEGLCSLATLSHTEYMLLVAPERGAPATGALLGLPLGVNSSGADEAAIAARLYELVGYAPGSYRVAGYRSTQDALRLLLNRQVGALVIQPQQLGAAGLRALQRQEVVPLTLSKAEAGRLLRLAPWVTQESFALGDGQSLPVLGSGIGLFAASNATEENIRQLLTLYWYGQKLPEEPAANLPLPLHPAAQALYQEWQRAKAAPAPATVSTPSKEK